MPGYELDLSNRCSSKADVAMDIVSTLKRMNREVETLERVAIDVVTCRRLGALLKSQPVPEEREEQSLEGFTTKQVGNFYLVLVGICHQTSPLNGQVLEGNIGERKLRGWDYLSAKLEAQARQNPQFLSPKSWSQISESDVRRIFRGQHVGGRLTDPAGRAQLIRDLGRKMHSHSWEYADQIYQNCDGRILTGSPNLINVLSSFKAYSDPVKKKSFFFLSLMQNRGVWTYTDPTNLAAPVDYHEVRGHLRLGSVRINDVELRAKLMAGSEVTPEDDILIRQAVQEALGRISDYSGLCNPSRAHYAFWNIFRSCCTRENPHCKACPSNCTLPERYVPLTLFPDGTRRCAFSDVCASANIKQKFQESRVKTNYY